MAKLLEQIGFVPEAPSAAELRDPGLYPEFRLFVSNRLTEYVTYAPGRINALVSAHVGYLAPEVFDRYLTHLPAAREVCLDSGVITPLLQVMHGKARPDVVHEWLEAGHEAIVAQAWRIHNAGVVRGVVSALDLPSYADMLRASQITIAQAQAVTLDNTARMLEESVPPGWAKLFVLQAHTMTELDEALDAYAALGVREAVRSGAAWLSVGGLAFEDEGERVRGMYRRAREWLGTGHIHALGINRSQVLVPMILDGWVNSADSSSPVQEIMYNRGPYRVMGPRPTFLANALFAANALLAEVELARAIEYAQTQPRYEQEGLLL